jgi:glycosyltransferase involved in cell wall biosynthesis/ADP-heptose:LPS heptosyltransferase
MRLVLDMQGAQTESRFRGVGRYSLSLAQAIARNRGEHEIILALSSLFPETIEHLRAAFEGLLPQENIRVWCAPGPIREADTSNYLRREVAERIREAFLADLKPDVVLITSLVEGLGDDAVTSVGVFDTSTPIAVILYDLIPLINPDIHFRTNKIYQDWYSRKISSLKRSRLLLAISESSKREALEVLDFAADDIVNAFGACDASFRYLNLSEVAKRQVYRKAGIARPFVMYTGGADDRKNLYRLIEAYASLPKKLRRQYQLVFVGKMPEGHVRDFLDTARNHGLANDEIICTGYVEDGDLIGLYNSCALFVFPSLHEGLGLPPMEAMSCGAPVICSNATSLPEVVGWEEALFDPTSVQSIATKLEQALIDETFRQRLSEYGRLRAREFSWDESAKRALQALSRFDHGEVANQPLALLVERTSLFSKRHLRILVLKLDHRGDFLLAVPAITKLKARYPYAMIDIVVGSWNLPIAKELKLFDNIYVLDYFRKVSAEVPSVTEAEIDALIKQFGEYEIAIDLRRQMDTRFILVKIDARLKVGYETFDPSIDSKFNIKLKAYPDVPFKKTPLNRTHISEQMLRLVDVLPADINDYVYLPELTKRVPTGRIEVAMFPTAGNDVKQWSEENYIALANLLVADERVDAVNVYYGSEKEASRYEFMPNPKLRPHCNLDFPALVKSLSKSSICVANNSFGAHVASYSDCLVIGVYGGHETISEWAPVFGESYVIHCAAFCSPCHIPNRSHCANGMFCLNDISVRAVFDKVSEAITSQKQGKTNNQLSVVASSGRTSSQIVDDLIGSIAALDLRACDGNQRVLFAENIARNHRLGTDKRQLLVDVSELVQRDAKSGIQRVVRAVLGQLLRNPPEGFVVEPVYAVADALGYRYARSFTNGFLGNSQGLGDDTLAEAWSGDLFLGLDLHPLLVPAQEGFLKAWRQRGVGVYFVIYDLLPVLMPSAFPEGAAGGYHRWLGTIARFDGAIAISKAVADELRNWLQVFGQPRELPFHIGWFHLGADIENSAPTFGIPETAPRVFSALAARPSFLMLGTVEPRKGQAQTFAAFEQLWQAGEAVNLLIVGKQGWMVDDLIGRFRSHPEFNKKFYWLEGISDEYLEKVYAASTCLIAASEGEGFGLPLIEAAQHKLPIIARDIPVFREVAGEHAYYFSGLEAADLANAVKDWLALDKAGAPRSDTMPWQTWKQSTQNLLDVILGGQWYQQWMPDDVRRFWGSDNRLGTQVGKRTGHEIVSKGQAGYLIYGLYVALAAGQYRVVIRGALEKNGAVGARMVVACNKGNRILGESVLSEPNDDGCLITLTISLDAPCTDLEVRVWVSENTQLHVSMIEIAPWQGEQETCNTDPEEIVGAIPLIGMRY